MSLFHAFVRSCFRDGFLRILLLMLLGFSVVRPSLAGDWPGWRGPEGTGVSPEKNLPVTWSATENVRWKVPLHGAGVSTPIVWGDRVFLTVSYARLRDQP